MAATKGHKKKAKGAKAAKAASSARKKARAAAADGPDGLAPKTRRALPADPAAAKARNPRAFTVTSRGRAKIQRARTAEKEQKRVHAPAVDAAAAEADVDAPPFVVLVHGPPGAGKTTLIKALVKHYTRQGVADPRGPVTVVAGRARRLTLLECPPDVMGMVDAAKIADLVLLLVDAAYGFEMETFEFLNMLQVAGFPKVMGVLTHLDGFRDAAKLKKAKKALKHRFWTEVYAGAKLFYLSGLRHGSYPKREVLNLARFISVIKFRPLAWRSAHGYVLADRVEDVTPGAVVAADPAADRTVALYGYVRGAAMRGDAPRVHVPGVGDFTAAALEPCPDPCPRPGVADASRRKRLGDRDRLIYAPMSDVGRLLFDKDAMYVDIPDHKVAFTREDGGDGGGVATTEGVRMVQTLQAAPRPVDAALAASTIRLFEGGAAVAGGDWAAEEEEGAPHARRAAPVGTGVAINAGAALDSDAEEDDDDEDGDDSDDTQSESDDGGADDAAPPSPPSSSDSEGLGGAARWKAALADNAARLYASRGVDLAAAVYGGGSGAGGADAADSDSDGELFTRRGAGPAGLAKTADAAPATPPAAADADAAAPPLDVGALLAYGDAARVEALRDRFVTGDWGAAAARGEARPGDGGGVDDDDDGDAVFGDWEDVEAAANGGGPSGDAAVDAARAAIAAAEAEAAAEAKAAKKAAFDAAYDEGGGAAGVVGDDGGDAAADADADARTQRGDEGPNFYDDAKAALAARAARTRAALDALPARERAALAGVAPGTYVKLTLAGMPCELMAHFSPRRPLYAGALTPADEGRTFLQLRFKRHRWAPRTLKTRDPLVLSIGWRRVQSLPVYAAEDANGRHRALKYTPDHAHCIAHAFGPAAPAGTGVLAVQAGAARAAAWRVAATGAVLGADPVPRVVKKIKLVGEPATIHRRTAFVKGMFNSPLEAAKFEGAAVRTAAGLRGIIKKAATDRAAAGAPGTVRVTFEDKPLLSDVVFLRAWVAVDLPRACVPVTDLLAPAAGLGRARGKREDDGADAAAPATPPPSAPTAPASATFDPAPSFGGARPGWVFGTGPAGTGYYKDGGAKGGRPTCAGASTTPAATAPAAAVAPPDPLAAASTQGWVPVRTVAELRRAAGVGAPRAPDSLYKPIDRPEKRVFNPLRVPKALQAALPFKSKPREAAPRTRKSLDQKRAVVRSAGERRTAALVAQLNAIRNAKAGKRRAKEAAKRAKHADKVAADAVWRGELLKERKKARWVEQGRAAKAAERKRQRRE